MPESSRYHLEQFHKPSSIGEGKPESDVKPESDAEAQDVREDELENRSPKVERPKTPEELESERVAREKPIHAREWSHVVFTNQGMLSYPKVKEEVKSNNNSQLIA